MTQTDWSQAEDKKLLRMWLAEEPPRTTREIADALEKSKSAVYRRIRTFDADGEKGNRDLYERITGKSLEPAIKPVRVETEAAPSGSSLKSDFTALVWGDVHVPFEDPRAVKILKQVAADVQPEVLVCLGDVFDFFSISDYRPPKSEKKDLQRTLNAGVKHLAEMLEVAQPDRAVYLGGNHDDRWERMMLKARDDVRFRQLLKIPKIRRFLEFEQVVGFEELGYEYYPYQEGKNFVLKDVLLITHGEYANKYAARKHLDVYGMNIIHGHTHQIQNFTRRTMKGQEAGFSVGCLCNLNPHYDESVANWQHGFALVHFAKAGRRWLFDVEQVRIHDGVAVVCDDVYKA